MKIQVLVLRPCILESFGLIFPGLDFSSVKWDSWALRSAQFSFFLFFSPAHMLSFCLPLAALINHPSHFSPLSLETVLESFWHGPPGSHQQSSELALEVKRVCHLSTWRSCFIPKCCDSLKWEIINSFGQIADSPRRASWPGFTCYIVIWGVAFSFQTTNWVCAGKDTFFSSNWTSFLGWAPILSSCWNEISVKSCTPSDSPRHCIWVPWTHVEPRHDGRAAGTSLTCLWWHLWRHPC